MSKEIKLMLSRSGLYYGDFNDIAIGTDTFDMILLDNEEKLQQQICKFLLTEVGTTPLFPGYGTKISTLLNNRLNQEVVGLIKNEIDAGLKYIKSMNSLNDNGLNIDKVLSINLSVVNGNELDIRLAIQLTNGNLLQIHEKAIGS